MLTVSRKCNYGVRAVLDLAEHWSRGPRTIQQIAQGRAIPRKFLAAILAQLRQSGVIESRRGTHGGYVLARTPDAVTLAEVVNCLSSTRAAARARSSGTPPAAGDVLEDFWGQLARTIAQQLNSTTFQELVEQAQAATAATAQLQYLNRPGLR